MLIVILANVVSVTYCTKRQVLVQNANALCITFSQLSLLRQPLFVYTQLDFLQATTQITT